MKSGGLDYSHPIRGVRESLKIDLREKEVVGSKLNLQMVLVVAEDSLQDKAGCYHFTLSTHSCFQEKGPAF